MKASARLDLGEFRHLFFLCVLLLSNPPTVQWFTAVDIPEVSFLSFCSFHTWVAPLSHRFVMIPNFQFCFRREVRLLVDKLYQNSHFLTYSSHSLLVATKYRSANLPFPPPQVSANPGSSQNCPPLCPGVVCCYYKQSLITLLRLITIHFMDEYSKVQVQFPVHV